MAGSSDDITKDVTLPSAPEIRKAQDQLFASGKSASAKYAELVVGRPGFGALRSAGSGARTRLHRDWTPMDHLPQR